MEQGMVNSTALAHIITGEVGVCGPLAMLALAYVYQRNKTFYGYSQDYVSPMAAFIANHWWVFPDITQGRTHMFSGDDLLLPEVQEIINDLPPPRRDNPLRFKCAAGLEVYVY